MAEYVQEPPNEYGRPRSSGSGHNRRLFPNSDPEMPVLEPMVPLQSEYHSDVDDDDKEVEYATRKRKRRKGPRWTKRKTSHSSLSSTSRSRSRPQSTFSEASKTTDTSGVSRSRSRPQSTFSEASKITYNSGVSCLTGTTTDYADSEGLLIEYRVRTDNDLYSVTPKRKRKRRGYKWTRVKSSRSTRSQSRATTYSRASRKTVASAVSRADTITKKLIVESRSKSVRLKNMFNDILATKGNLRDFTTAYLIQEKSCFEFYHSEDEEVPLIPIVKTRFACKVRDEVFQAYRYSVYECPLCNRCFLEACTVTKHMCEEHRLIPLYICEECNMHFVYKGHYEVHKEVHDRCFKAYCLFCSEEFTHRKPYEKHMNCYIACSYKCLYCQRLYLDIYTLKKHVKRKHVGMRFFTKPTSRILCRVDYDKPLLYRNNREISEFVVRILIQTSRIDERNCDTPDSYFGVR